MPRNLVQKKVFDRQGRWVTRWVRPEGVAAGASHPPPPAPVGGTDEVAGLATSAIGEIFLGDASPSDRTSGHVWMLAEHGPEVLAHLVDQCRHDPEMRRIWARTLTLTASGTLDLPPSVLTNNAHVYGLRVQAYPTIIDLLRRTGRTGNYSGETARACNSLYLWQEWMPGSRLVSPDAVAALYLLGIAQGVDEMEGFEVPALDSDAARALRTQAGALAGRVGELADIVPHLIERKDASPQTVEALLRSQSGALRAGEL